MTEEITLWEGTGLARIPASARTPEAILPFANSRQLSERDRSQIIYAFNNQGYEMASNFIWSKAISSLKAQLATLGTGFISEMLDRADISEGAVLSRVLTDYDALRLARELGVVTNTGYFRLKQAFDRIAHFGQIGPEESDDVAMSADEALGVIRACVGAILGQNKIDVAVDFKKFRNNLESRVFDKDDNEISRLATSPYFFRRASIRILLALIKTKGGAQLENALGNANVVVPLLWSELLPPERFQIGRAYSEIVGDGKAKAASGLKRILVRVKGFDYVPEDLRSRSFSIAAQAVVDAHEAMNNFYNEPVPMRVLAEMGSTIPPPAFPLCMTAALCVRLGNQYGISYEAQHAANGLLRRVSQDRWLFYLDRCLRGDERILEKLNYDGPFARWTAVVEEFGLESVVEDSKDRDIRHLIKESKDAMKPSRARVVLGRLLRKIGFAEG